MNSDSASKANRMVIALWSEGTNALLLPARCLADIDSAAVSVLLSEGQRINNIQFSVRYAIQPARFG